MNDQLKRIRSKNWKIKTSKTIANEMKHSGRKKHKMIIACSTNFINDLILNELSIPSPLFFFSLLSYIKPQFFDFGFQL